MRQISVRPNLFVVGAMKSGTSSLHSYLAEHPSVFMCQPKEPCYFVEPSQLDWPAIERLGLGGHEERYLALFRDAGDAVVVGESSTLYTKAPKISGVPERIARFSPGARIVYLMRDPVERTVSHYWHAVRDRKETRPLLTALRDDPHYLDVSHYAFQIRRYVELFGRERVHLLTLETMRDQPQEKVSELLAWLGVNPDLVPEDLRRRRNVTPRRFQRPRGSGRLDRFRYSRVWESFGSHVPGILRSLGRRMALRDVHPKQAPGLPEVVDFLRPIQLCQTEALEGLTGRRFPEWRILHGGGLPASSDRGF